MTTLESLVSQFADLSSPELVYSAITENSVKEIVYKGEQSIAAIEKAYGIEFAISLMVTMNTVIAQLNNIDQNQAQYLDVYFDRLKYGIGLDFSDDAVQNQLTSLTPLFGADIVNKLKAMGVVYKSKWKQTTNEPTPTLEEVIVAIENENEKRHRIAWIEYVKNGILSNNGNGKTIAELKQLIAERE